MFQNIYGLYNNGLLTKDLIKDMINSNLTKYQIFEDYYKGYHWQINGVTTRAGLPAIDSTEKDKIYYGVVDNKVKEVTDLMVSLSLGVKFFYHLNSNDIKIDWDKFASDMFFNLYKFRKAYYTVGFNNQGQFQVRVIPTMNSFPVKNSDGQIIEFTELDVEDKKYNLKNYAFGYAEKFDGFENYEEVVYFREITDLGIEREEMKKVMPIYEVDLGFDYFASLIPIQDLINVKKTQLFEIDKYEGDPFTQISGVKLMDENGKRIDPRQLVLKSGKIIITDTDGQVKRISGNGAPQSLIDEIKEEEKNFYKHAKLNGLRNDDLSGITSGYAIELKMIDTLGFVRMARQKVMIGLQPVIEMLDQLNGPDKFELKFGNIIDFGLNDKITEGKGLKELGYTDEEIKNYISL